MSKGARNRATRPRIENQITVVRNTGIKIEATAAHGKDMPDPGEGKHLWTVVGCWNVIPNDSGYILDTENLMTLQGPGCFKCEKPYSAELAAQPCTGDVDEPQPLYEVDEPQPMETGGPFGDGMK